MSILDRIGLSPHESSVLRTTINRFPAIPHTPPPVASQQFPAPCISRLCTIRISRLKNGTTIRGTGLRFLWYLFTDLENFPPRIKVRISEIVPSGNHRDTD